MATGDVYMNPGTEITFQSSGGTVAITIDENCTAENGVTSAAWEAAEAYTTARPEEYRWTCKAYWGAGAVVGETLDLYLAEANADGEYDGGATAATADFTDEQALKNMTYVGSVICTTATEEQEYASGVVRVLSNKALLVVWNASAAAPMHATATNFEFKLLPIPMAVQS